MDDENRQKSHLSGEIQPEPDPPLPPPAANPDGPGPMPAEDPPAVPGRPLRPAGVNERLDNLYNEVDIVKMNSMRRIAEELNRKDGESERDVQKESQTVLKSVEIQTRLLAERRRGDPESELEPALNDIWQALINIPEAGAILRRDSVRARIIQTLRQRLG